jgi:preprotein translocase subunit SecB
MAAQHTARILSERQQAPEPSVTAAPLLLNTQYVKEFSFRVPGAPAIYASMPERPLVTLALDVLVRPIPEGRPPPIFEVTLTMKCEATIGPSPPDAPPSAIAYQIELGYAGIFTLAKVPQNAIEPVLLAECPRLLFPFARSMLADITREAGFPPLLLQPIDFIAFWQNKRQQNAQLSQPRQPDI